MKLRLILLLGVLPASLAAAQVTLPKLLSDHMVVQRDVPVHVWGMAAAGEQVSVTFRGETRSTIASKLGQWSVYLKPGAAGGPFEMTVKGMPAAPGMPAAAGTSASAATPATAATPADTPAGSSFRLAPQAITLRDVLVGDVWVASGQSNMGFPLKNAITGPADLLKADNPKIRLLIVDQTPEPYPQPDIQTKGWAASSPESAPDFSAVAWYFAREIEQREHIPVGVIDSSWGGTPAEAWTSMTALGADPGLAPLFLTRGNMMMEAADTALQVKDEQRQIDEARKAGKPAPQFPWHPDFASFGPANLWNGMIAPITPFAIKGAIWYQGEANAGLDRYPTYDRVMRTLIEDWRAQWGIGRFPFFYVQLANWNTGEGTNWAWVRNQQLKTLGLRNTGMAVTIDIGNPDDIHPKDKLDVGHRLALWARATVYGESNLEFSGPLFREATPDGNAIRVWFDHARGLMAKGGEVTSVEVAGADGKFVPAKAVIEGETLVASSPDVASPVKVRYGWASNPQCNLFNGDGLPASPFTSEK